MTKTMQCALSVFKDKFFKKSPNSTFVISTFGRNLLNLVWLLGYKGSLLRRDDKMDVGREKKVQGIPRCARDDKDHVEMTKRALGWQRLRKVC